jgi:hypothetical protein
MGQADEVPTIFGKKLIANEIEGRGHMATAIDIGVELPSVIDEEPIDPVVLADQPKFLNRAGLHFLCTANNPSPQPALPNHSALITKEQNPSDD